MAGCTIGRPALFAGAVLLSGLILVAACERADPKHASITGKTVYAGMGIEEVPIRALRWNGDRWEEIAVGRSTYHGAFVLRVPPGTYRIEARGTIPMHRKNIPVAGGTDRIEVPPGIRRIDRVRIELSPAGKRESNPS